MLTSRTHVRQLLPLAADTHRAWGTDGADHAEGLRVLQYTRARHYDPSTGRFMQRDPVLDNVPTLHYIYAHNNPLAFTDPSGEGDDDPDAAAYKYYPGGVLGGDIAPTLVDRSKASELIRRGLKGYSQQELAGRIADMRFAKMLGVPYLGEPPISPYYDKAKGDRPYTYEDVGLSPEQANLIGLTYLLAPIIGPISEATALRASRMIRLRNPELYRLGVRYKLWPSIAQGGAIQTANFAQLTFSEQFSKDGAEIFSNLAGRPIKTVSDLTEAVRDGTVQLEDIPVNYVVRDGKTLILNTRTARALERAGIPRKDWYAVDRTGDPVFEDLLTGQLKRNQLGSEGVPRADSRER